MRTLRARVTATTVLVATLGLAVGAWGFARATEDALVTQLDRELAADARAIADRSRAGAQLATLASATPPDRVVQVPGPEGALMAASAHHVRQPTGLDRLEVVTGAPSPPGAGWISGRSDLARLGEGWRVTRATGPGGSGRVEVVVAAPLADLRAAAGTAGRIASASVPLLAAAVGVLVWIALGRLLRPIEDLRRQAAAAADIYPPPRLATGRGGDEIAALLHTLDTLLQRSAAGVRRQRRFLASASHELLSPLATLRTVLEVAPRSGDPSGMHDAIERSLQAQARLEQTAQQLLAVARAEDADGMRMVDVDLVPVVRDVVCDLAAGDVEVRTGVPGTLRLTGDRMGLGQLVGNLARNAVRHAAARVEIRLTATRDTVVLDVDDDGAGVPPEHRHDVFAPFVRLGEAHARRTGGAGLGLTIAHAVAVRHGGGITVDTSPLGGARFHVVLPRRATTISVR